MSAAKIRGEALYFTYVTGLTIGYGDLVPKHAMARILALLIGLLGTVFTGLVVAVTVHALTAAVRSSRIGRMGRIE